MLTQTLNAAPKTHMPASFTSTEDLRHGLAKLTPELFGRALRMARSAQVRSVPSRTAGSAGSMTAIRSPMTSTSMPGRAASASCGVFCFRYNCGFESQDTGVIQSTGRCYGWDFTTRVS